MKNYLINGGLPVAALTTADYLEGKHYVAVSQSSKESGAISTQTDRQFSLKK